MCAAIEAGEVGWKALRDKCVTLGRKRAFVE
jgi:hypothetical protein